MAEDNTQEHLNDLPDITMMIQRLGNNLTLMREMLMNRFDRFEEQLAALEAQAEERSRETPPIWEKALAEIMAVGENVKELKGSVALLVEDVHGVRAKQREADLRLKELESYLHRA